MKKNRYILNEQDENNSQRHGIMSILERMKDYTNYIKSLSEKERDDIKNNSKNEDSNGNNWVILAKGYIEAYKAEHDDESYEIIKKRNVNVKEILTNFCSAINAIVPEATYSSNFAPVFDKANIKPIPLEAPKEKPTDSAAPAVAATTAAAAAGTTTDKTATETKTTEPSKPAETPKIKFGGTEQTAYVDMGGGKYIPANEEQLGDPNVQLYVKNPNKGQSEYLKPNFVKVRREGNELRKQSQFGGALGSLSNFLGDVGNTLSKSGNTQGNPSREAILRATTKGRY